MGLELKIVCEKCEATLAPGRSRIHLQLRMHLLRNLRRADEFRLSKLRR